jgi:hypothetical protein
MREAARFGIRICVEILRMSGTGHLIPQMDSNLEQESSSVRKEQRFGAFSFGSRIASCIRQDQNHVVDVK